MRIAKVYTAEEMLQVLNKNWLNTNDLKILSGRSIEKSRQLKNEITEKLEKEGYRLPVGFVPAKEVIDYLNLNISYLKKVANQ